MGNPELHRGLREAALVEKDLDGLGRRHACREPRGERRIEAGHGRNPLIRTRDERHPPAGKLSQAAAKKLARLNASQLQKVAGLALSGEEITEDLVKSTLRMQVNAGLVPLQAALETSMTSATAQGEQFALEAGGSTEGCLSGGAPASLEDNPP